jgi:hypothetical protein
MRSPRLRRPVNVVEVLEVAKIVVGLQVRGGHSMT